MVRMAAGDEGVEAIDAVDQTEGLQPIQSAICLWRRSKATFSQRIQYVVGRRGFTSALE